MKRVAIALILACATACKTNPTGVDVPCHDTTTIIHPGGAETVKSVECHPQASIDTVPVGSAVVVTCRCNILPEPCACDIPWADGGAGD